MKKTITILLAIAFVATAAMSSFGATAMDDEAQAVRNYLKVVDAKLAKAKKANQSAKVNQLHAEKAATLARWNKLKASKVPPAPVIVNPAPIVIINPPAQTGRGVGIYVNGGLDAGLIGFAGNLDYDLSGVVTQGLSARVGLNYVSGTNPSGNDSMKAVSAKLGAVYYITPYLPNMGVPLTWYVGGAYLLPVKVNAGRTGKWGAEAYLGANYVVPEMGTINFELGYSGLKYADSQPALKGLDLKIGYGILF
jgi:hypothetical protein